MKTFQDFLHIMDFNGNQTVQGQNTVRELTTKWIYYIIRMHTKFVEKVDTFFFTWTNSLCVCVYIYIYTHTHTHT